MAISYWKGVAQRAIKNPKLALSNAIGRTNATSAQGASTNTGLYGAAKAFFTPQTARASSVSPDLVQSSTSGNYSLRAKINEDGSVGFDYFLNGQPITETQYAQAGMNLADDQELAVKDLQINIQQQALNQPAGTSGGTGGTAPTPDDIRYFNGAKYTNDIAGYTNAVTEAAIAEFNRQNKLLTDAYNTGLLEFGQYQDQLKQARDTVKEQYGQAMSSIGGRFSAMSPDAYQSSQGGAETKAQDITNQNYANIAGQEANLNLQRNQYDQDYANNLESNTISRQNQIDSTLNEVSNSLAGTPYANQLSKINAPKLNTMTPMDNSILGVYDNLSQLQSGGNTAAIKSTIDQLQVEPNIKDWLYTRFNPQTV